jgi:hypothetical protein
MDAAKLTAIVTLILALSVASERLVEIIKGFISKLDKPNTTDEKAEARRRSYLQILAVISGVLTAYLASDYLPTEIAATASGKSWSIVGLGLLASGGSGFWNSILTYVTKVKDIKKLEAEEKKKAAG